MKISKLFHWLYAFLMFLPIVFFIPNAFYFGFNEHATAQERTEQEPVYYDTNEINDIDDFVVGNVYYWSDSWNVNEVTYNGPTTTFFQVIMLDNKFNTSGYADFYLLNNKHLYVQYRKDDNTLGYEFIERVPFHFLFRNYTENKDLTPQYLLDRILPTQYIKEYQPIVYSMSISDSMHQAWQTTWELPLFSWTHNSFVSEPFGYITGLFGVPADSTLNYVFAYFVSISICWLVFDLVMWVPNLAHRWLDRSSLQ